MLKHDVFGLDSGKGQLVNLVPTDLVLDYMILGYL
jgi:hypothetical protein